MFEALLDRRIEEQNRAQFLAGIVAAAIQNCFRGEGSKPVDPIDYVPDYVARRKQEPKTEDEMIASMTSFFGCGPGLEN